MKLLHGVMDIIRYVCLHLLVFIHACYNENTLLLVYIHCNQAQSILKHKCLCSVI